MVPLGLNVDHDGDAGEGNGGAAAMYFVVVVRVSEEEAEVEVDVGPVAMHRSVGKYVRQVLQRHVLHIYIRCVGSFCFFGGKLCLWSERRGWDHF